MVPVRFVARFGHEKIAALYTSGHEALHVLVLTELAEVAHPDDDAVCGPSRCDEHLMVFLAPTIAIREGCVHSASHDAWQAT